MSVPANRACWIQLIFASVFLLLSMSGCIWLFRDVAVRDLEGVADYTVKSPVRVHFEDGRTAVFPDGAQFTADRITGTGDYFDLDLTRIGQVASVSTDSVVAVETYHNQTDVAQSAAVSILATGAAAFAGSLVAVAIFGSCPTVYSGEGDTAILEAEAFPNSIVSLFEQRDVDPLLVGTTSEGVVELQVRNEALETHYINHMELLEVRHPRGAAVLPAPDGLAYVVQDLQQPSRAVDRSQRNVLEMLQRSDEAVFSTDPATLAAATPEDLIDYIDVTFPAPRGDSTAIVLNLRNSLLNTVYFYDIMLANQGARSLDWLGRDLESISYAIGVGDFFARYMGLRVQIWDREGFREVGKVREVGPIAWDRVAVPLPVPDGDSLHIRLRFVADSWRIDEVALAENVRTVSPRRIPLTEIRTTSVSFTTDPVKALSASDESYVITQPGTRFWTRFDVGVDSGDLDRSFLLATQGYYTEWIRRDWLENPASTVSFEPSTVTLHAAMRRWQEVKPVFEAQFETSKIPVR